MVLMATTLPGDATPHELLTPRERWNEDFVRYAPATATCPGGSLDQVRTRLYVSGPLLPEQLETPLSSDIRARLRTGDALYSFHRFFDEPGRRPWGFAGHLVAHGDCIVHADVTGYDN
ncbi:MAG: hypothetical protein QM795_12835 [Pseudoxanthomonas sp.]